MFSEILTPHRLLSRYLLIATPNPAHSAGRGAFYDREEKATSLLFGWNLTQTSKTGNTLLHPPVWHKTGEKVLNLPTTEFSDVWYQAELL